GVDDLHAARLEAPEHLDSNGVVQVRSRLKPLAPAGKGLAEQDVFRSERPNRTDMTVQNEGLPQLEIEAHRVINDTEVQPSKAAPQIHRLCLLRPQGARWLQSNESATSFAGENGRKGRDWRGVDEGGQ